MNCKKIVCPLILLLSVFLLQGLFLLSCGGTKATSTTEGGVIAEKSKTEIKPPSKLEVLKKNIDQMGRNAEAHYNLAQEYVRLGFLDNANVELDTSLAITYTVKAKIKKAEIKLVQGKGKEGYSDLASVADDPSAATYMEQLGGYVSDAYKVTRLTYDNSNEGFPDFSPDGNQIAFQSNRNGNWDIFVMKPDGTGQRQVTNIKAENESPVYSKTGKLIIFTSTRDDLRDVPPEEKWREIYLIDPFGGNLTRLTNNQSDDFNSRFSQDGNLIVFSSTRNDVRALPSVLLTSDVYTMDGNGNFQTRITNISGFINNDGSFSPDGRKIIFSSDRDESHQIYTMNLDGTDQKRLIESDGDDSGPRYSPDGSKIVFYSNRLGTFSIFMANSDGTGVKRLTGNYADEYAPSWSPDGTKILFHTNRDGNFEIYQLDLTQPATYTSTEIVDLLKAKAASLP